MAGSELFLFHELVLGPIVKFGYVFIEIDFEIDFIELFLFVLTV